MKTKLFLLIAGLLTAVSANADVTAADLFGSSERPAGQWTGFSSERYKDMSFYNRDGVARLEGRIIDYTPDCGIKVFSVETVNDLKGSKDVHVGEIGADGTFALDIPVQYPQMDYFRLGEAFAKMFLIPGDTLSLVTSIKTGSKPGMRKVPAYYRFEGAPDDGIVINVLADSVSLHFDLVEMWQKTMLARDSKMKQATYALSERMSTLLDSIVTELPILLGELPVSAFAKDIVSVLAIGDVCEAIEDLDMNFRIAFGPEYMMDGKFRPGEFLDVDTLLSPHRNHLALMYDNPLMICRGSVLPNRWKYNHIFLQSGRAACGQKEVLKGASYTFAEEPLAPLNIDMARLYSIGVGNCFVSQLVRTAEFIEKVNTNDAPSSDNMDKNRRLVAGLLRYTDYEPMAEELMLTYTDEVRDVMFAENKLAGERDNSIQIDGSAEGDVLQKIIAPYRGNVLFLDFWGIGCGPCRIGMIGQKPMLTEYAGKPFKVLYIANADEGMEACKKWLRKEEIGGEHIFISSDDWTRLRALFNFTGIPYGVLIDENGTVLKTGVHMPADKYLLDEILKKR